MPRKGPKKITRRDDRDSERHAERCKLQSAAVRAKKAEVTLNVYKTQSNPNMPTSKWERRALREALSAEGVSLERWNSGEFEECFFHIARDRYVNNKFPDIYSTAKGEDKAGQWESDSWLQMYLHVPEDYREKVSKVLETFHPPQRDERKTLKPKSPTNRISRRQAKAAAEGVIKTHVSSDPVVCDATSSAPVTDNPTTTGSAVPEGKVKIINHGNKVLCASPTGQVFWRNPSDTEAAADSTWTVVPTIPGKCNLRSAHDRFLCHCMWADFVADRTSASWWEELKITAVASDNSTPTDQVFYTIMSWRGMYLGKKEEKVGVTNKVDTDSKFIFVSAV